MCPTGVTSVAVECWGGGGPTSSAGGGMTVPASAGGGGGAYSASVLTVVPSTVYTVSVGGPGGDSYFDTNTTVMAKGASGSTGGSSASGVGTTKYSGGNGAAASGSGAGASGGGGGASAASGGAGASASGRIGATAGFGGGSGSNGGLAGSGGDIITGIPGGGSGGRGYGGSSYSAGGGGSVALTYTASGGGGEPHFVGFDGERFDYHGIPGEWFLLWDGVGMRIESLFQLEPAAALYPNFEGTTFMTKIRVMLDGVVKEYGAYDVWEPLKEGWEGDCGMMRGLPPALQIIEGNVIGVDIFPFALGSVILTCMTFHGWYGKREFNFLNIAFDDKAHSLEVTGILGQTMRPSCERVENSTYLLNRD